MNRSSHSILLGFTHVSLPYDGLPPRDSCSPVDKLTENLETILQCLLFRVIIFAEVTTHRNVLGRQTPGSNHLAESHFLAISWAQRDL